MTLDYTFKNFSFTLNKFRVYPITEKGVLLFIREIDKERMIFDIFEVHLNRRKVVESTVGIHKLDLIENENLIFPNGRSRSKYLNAYTVLEYLREDLSIKTHTFGYKHKFLSYISMRLGCTVAQFININNEMTKKVEKHQYI